MSRICSKFWDEWSFQQTPCVGFVTSTRKALFTFHTSLVGLKRAAVNCELPSHGGVETSCPFTSWGALSKLLNFLVLQVSQLCNEVNNGTYATGLLCGLVYIRSVYHLARNKHSVKCSLHFSVSPLCHVDSHNEVWLFSFQPLSSLATSAFADPYVTVTLLLS